MAIGQPGSCLLRFDTRPFVQCDPPNLTASGVLHQCRHSARADKVYYLSTLASSSGT